MAKRSVPTPAQARLLQVIEKHLGKERKYHVGSNPERYADGDAEYVANADEDQPGENVVVFPLSRDAEMRKVMRGMFETIDEDRGRQEARTRVAMLRDWIELLEWMNSTPAKRAAEIRRLRREVEQLQGIAAE